LIKDAIIASARMLSWWKQLGWDVDIEYNPFTKALWVTSARRVIT
jgi:hypothetical protein